MRIGFGRKGISEGIWDFKWVLIWSIRVSTELVWGWVVMGFGFGFGNEFGLGFGWRGGTRREMDGWG